MTGKTTPRLEVDGLTITNDAEGLYRVTGFDTTSNPSDPFVERYGEPAVHATVLFQNGTVPEVGRNGVTIEALLEIAHHRLAVLDERFPCYENEAAHVHIKQALEWLNLRTKRRQARGVDGAEAP